MNNSFTIFKINWFGGCLPAGVSGFATFVGNVDNVEDAEVPTVVQDFIGVFCVEFCEPGVILGGCHSRHA
jgi:hypothetical protein